MSVSTLNLMTTALFSMVLMLHPKLRVIGVTMATIFADFVVFLVSLTYSFAYWQS